MSDILDRVFDKGAQVFERWADFEIRNLELEIAQERFLQQAQLDALNAPQSAATVPQAVQSLPWGTILLVAGIGAGAYFLLKKA